MAIDAGRKASKSLRTDAIVSVLISLFFMAYNGFLGFYYHIIFNASMFVYYFIVTIINMVIGYKLYSKSNKSSKSNFITLHIILLLLDLSLLVPIILTVTLQKSTNVSAFYSIVYGAYTIFKIVKSIIGYKKHRESNNILVAEAKVVSLIDALVTVMTMINIIIVAYYEQGTTLGNTLLIISLVSGIVFVIAIFAITIKSFKTGLKTIKRVN